MVLLLRRFVQSKETGDIYSTVEPQAAFHSRISFCLNTHNEAVKAMRYPPGSHKNDLETEEKRRERQQQEQDLAKQLAEDDDDEF
jgi:26S proteasome regulatory subunit N3